MKKDTEKTFFLHFHFREDFMERGGNPLALFQKIRELGELTIIPHPAIVPLLEEIHPKKLHLKWTLKLITTEHRSRIERLLLPVTADEKNHITLELAELPSFEPMTTSSLKREGSASQTSSISPKKAMMEETTASKIEEAFHAEEDFSFKGKNLPKIITHKITTSSLYMLVQIGKNIFSIHHKFIEEFFRVEPNQIQKASEGEFLEWNGTSIRVIRLHHLLRFKPSTPHISQVCLVRGKVEEQPFVLVVDQLIQEYYQKTQHIYENLSRLPFVSGAIELESNYTGFVLDMHEVLSTVKSSGK